MQFEPTLGFSPLAMAGVMSTRAAKAAADAAAAGQLWGASRGLCAPRAADAMLRRLIHENEARGAQDFTFDSFVVGRPNAAAASASVDMATRLRPAPSLSILGESGGGKSHLLHAIAARRKASFPNQRVLRLEASAFLSAYVDAARRREAALFEEALGRADLLLIDDAMLLTRVVARDALRRVLDRLRRRGGSVVLALDSAPDPARLGRRLSALLCAHIVSLPPADPALRLALLQFYAAKQSAQIPSLEIDDALPPFLAKRLDCAPRVLIGALNRVMAAAVMRKRVANVALAKQELADLLPKLSAKRRADAVRYGLRATP